MVVSSGSVERGSGRLLAAAPVGTWAGAAYRPRKWSEFNPTGLDSAVNVALWKAASRNPRYRHIIFVAHSLGGLITKYVLHGLFTPSPDNVRALRAVAG